MTERCEGRWEPPPGTTYIHAPTNCVVEAIRNDCVRAPHDDEWHQSPHGFRWRYGQHGEVYMDSGGALVR